MMRDLYNALPLPDDRPITSICVVEELPSCPPNYTVVAKTHDQDIDADLYKDGFFRRVTRYLCHSKVEGYLGNVVEQLFIVPDRDSRPSGCTIVEQTHDTNQKAFKKRQLCFKQVPLKMATQTITDIIILSRSKLAPEGFVLVGEMNGMSICVKLGPTPNPSSQQPSSRTTSQPSSLPYGMAPRGGSDNGGGGGGGEMLYPGLTPARPAPVVPPTMPGSNNFPLGHPRPSSSIHQSYPGPPTSHTSNLPADSGLYGPTLSALFGVPFIINKQYVKSAEAGISHIPTFSKKNRQQIEDEYYYSFTLEQDIVQRPTISSTATTPAATAT